MSYRLDFTNNPSHPASQENKRLPYTLLLPLALAFLPTAQAQQEAVVELEEIEVKSRHSALGEAPPARTGGQVATGARMGILGNAEVMDTPFSVTSYTDKTIEDRHAQSVMDVLAADPSVRQNWPRTHATERLSIRGYTVASDSYAVGGMFGLSPSYRTYLEPFERVEVIKGPSSALFGVPISNTIGGIVNLVPKRAGSVPISKVTLSAAQDSVLGMHLDVGRRFANDAVGVRVNLMQREGDTALDWQSTRRKLASLAMDFRHGRLSGSLDAFYSFDDINNLTRPFNIPGSLRKLPRPPDGKNAYAGGGDYETKDSTWVTRLEYALTERLTAYLGYGEHRFRTDNTRIYPTFLNSSGDYSYTTHQNIQIDTDRSMQVGLRGTANTAFITHQYALDWSSVSRNQDRAGLNHPGGTLNLYLPSSARRITAPPRLKAHAPALFSRKLESLAIADTLGFLEDRLLLSLVFRQQKIINETHTNGMKYNKSANTPFVGVVYKVAPFASLYASYVEGLQQGGTAGSDPKYSNPNAQLAPYVAKQKELGVKLDFDDWLATLALYQLTRPIAGDDKPVSSPPIAGEITYKVIGEERSRGLELGISGQIVPDIRLLGGISFSRAIIAKSPDANIKGNKLAGVAPFQANMGTEWDALSDLTLTLSGMYTGRVPSRNDNGLYAPSWKTFDGGFRYRLGQIEDKSYLLRFNVHNLTNERYWGGTGSYLGAPRTWSLSLSMDI